MVKRSAKRRKRSTYAYAVENCFPRSPFEALPREMKYKIFQHLFDSLKSSDDIELFYKLKLVNREFYYLLSSDYAKRRSFVKSQFYLHVYSNYEDKSKINIYAYINSKQVASSENINWSDIPKFLEENRALLRGLSFRYGVLDENAFKAITEFAQKKPFTLVLFRVISWGKEEVDKYVKERLKDVLSSGKLKFQSRLIVFSYPRMGPFPRIEVKLEDGTLIR